MVVASRLRAFWILCPNGSYLNVTVPPELGSTTELSRFSKSQAYCVMLLESVLVSVFPFLSYVYEAAEFAVSSFDVL